MLDCHVGNRQTSFEAERANNRAGIFDHMPGAARRTQHARDMQHDVLCADAGSKLALDPDLHRFRLLQLQGLRRQHMLDFAGADAERQRTQPTVARGMAVAADYCRAGQ